MGRLLYVPTLNRPVPLGGRHAPRSLGSALRGALPCKRDSPQSHAPRRGAGAARKTPPSKAAHTERRPATYAGITRRPSSPSLERLASVFHRSPRTRALERGNTRTLHHRAIRPRSLG
jgi:hypothetical protein